MHRSPGVFFDHDKWQNPLIWQVAVFASRVIPYRGSWLDFEFDAKDIVNARIDRRRKLPVNNTALMALGMDGEEILEHFYDIRSRSRTTQKRLEHAF